jgi:PAS domain S-box-containing protein
MKGDTLVRCNRRFERMLGLSAGALTGQRLDALLEHDPRIKRVAVESVAKLQNGGQYESELEIIAPGHQPLWYALSIKRIGSSTNPLEAIAVLSNITRIRTQKAQLEAMGRDLALQADRTRAILDSVFVGIVTLDTSGISWMNRSARRMFGGDLPDFVGQPLSTVATSDLDHPFRMTDYLDDLQDGQSHTFECQVMGRDGRVFWVVGNAVVTMGEFNQRQTTYALLDIDRRRQAESRLAEAEATLKRIIEMAPMAISVHEAPSLRVLQANKSASAFMQRDVQLPMGESLEDIFPAPRARLLRAEMLTALDTHKPLHREHKVDGGKGPEQIWDVNYLPLSSDGQPTDQLLVVASDITEQRAAEKARLDAAIAQREMLVREVHHRIKNNLQGVAGLLQQIAARKPEVASAISEVVGQVQAIAQVYGLQVGAGGPLKLHSVVEAIAASVQRTFGHPIKLQVEGPMSKDWQLPEAESIPIALSLNELLTNAHKHGTVGQDISCTLRSDEQGVNICIQNTARLPEGFSMDRIRGGVSGLGLVRALLPRRSSSIAITQEGEHVLTRLQLTPPGISLSAAPPTLGEPAGQQYALWPQ